MKKKVVTHIPVVCGSYPIQDCLLILLFQCNFHCTKTVKKGPNDDSVYSHSIEIYHSRIQNLFSYSFSLNLLVSFSESSFPRGAGDQVTSCPGLIHPGISEKNIFLSWFQFGKKCHRNILLLLLLSHFSCVRLCATP